MARSKMKVQSKVQKLRRKAEKILELKTLEKRAERLEECLLETLESFEQMTDELSSRVEDLNLVYDVHQQMTELMDPDQLLPRIAESVATRMDVERCSIMVADEEGKNLYIKIGLGFDVPVENLPPAKVGKGISGQVAATGKPLLIKDIESDSKFARKSDKNKYSNNSLLCVPLKVKKHVIGVLNVNNKKDGTSFSLKDLELLTVLASAAAVSLNNATLHQRIEESWKYLNNIVENLGAGLFGVNFKNEVTLVNRSFLKLFGFDESSDMVGKTLRDVLPDPVGRYFNRLIKRTWREGNQREVDAEIDKLDNKNTVPAEVNTLLLRDENLQFHSQLIIVQDLSQSREVVKLRQLDSMKDNFISTVSHELRTPLTSMMASLSLILQGFVGDVTEKQEDLLKVVHRNAERLKNLINDLLDLSRLESGRTQLNFEWVDFDEIIGECVSEIEQLGKEKKIKVQKSLNFGSKLEIDPMKVQQVLINLVGNALKFTQAGGSVTVKTKKARDKVKVQVIDTGCGIPEDNLGSVFERFYQVEDALTRTQPGTGLGLPICKRIIELHGGRMGVTSEIGKGSCFEFVLPLDLSDEIRLKAGSI